MCIPPHPLSGVKKKKNCFSMKNNPDPILITFDSEAFQLHFTRHCLSLLTLFQAVFSLIYIYIYIYQNYLAGRFLFVSLFMAWRNVEKMPVKSILYRRFHFCVSLLTLLLNHQENNMTWPLPVKIFCKDEKGERVDVSKYLIRKGLALRERRYESFFSLRQFLMRLLICLCKSSCLCAFKTEFILFVLKNDL